jgi:NAD+ synthase (glutamine-hydrolysing)
MGKLKIALVQMNSTVGDLRGNVEKILQQTRYITQRYKPQIIIFPEGAITGYPAEDFLKMDLYKSETKPPSSILEYILNNPT